MSLTPIKGVWHRCRLFNHPWVDTGPAKYLGAHTSLIDEYLLEPLANRETLMYLAVRMRKYSRP